MKLSLIRANEDISKRMWREIDSTMRFALIGLGLARLDESGTPVLEEELPAALFQRVEKACAR